MARTCDDGKRVAALVFFVVLFVWAQLRAFRGLRPPVDLAYRQRVGRSAIDAAIERLRKAVSEGPHKGVLLEDATKVTGKNLSHAATRVGRWRSKAKRKRAKTMSLPDYLPEDYRYFLEAYGSLTWMAPDADPPDGWFYLHGDGDKALIELSDAASAYDVGEAAEAFGIEAPPIFVFQDGWSRGFAFDERVRNSAGEPLVIAFSEDKLSSIAKPSKRRATFGTFAEWLTTTVNRFLEDLEDRVPPARDDELVVVPESIVVPPGTEVTADEGALDEELTPGWNHLKKGAFETVLASVASMLKTEPLYLYAYAQGLDALGGLIARGDTHRRKEQWRLAWTLLALSRRGIASLDEDYNHLYRQKAATLLASMALEDSNLVSRADAKRLIAEALGLPTGKSDQMAMTGYWDSEAIGRKLA